MKPSYQRLESLDVLRGFDLFCLVALEGVLHPLGRAIDAPWYNDFLWCFSHVQWDGFSSWDLVMPLFMFMAGVSMPFALSRYKVMPDKWAVYRRIVKRVALLWIFGMMCQGNLFRIGPGPDLSLFEHIAGNCDGLSDFGNAVPACASVRADRDGGRLVVSLLGSHAIYYGRWLWRWQLHAGR